MTDKNEKTGLPQIDQDTKDMTLKKAQFGAIVAPIVTTLIGYGIAYLVYQQGDTEKFDRNLRTVKDLELHWYYAAMVVFNITIQWMNQYPMRYKEQVMKGGNLRANMFIYRLATEDPAESSAVVLQEDGDVGRYNRANRSTYHFLENCMGFVASLPIVFFTFVKPCIVIVAVYCFGRLLHQVGYTIGGYGGHAIGFVFALLAQLTVIGLLILSCTKTF